MDNGCYLGGDGLSWDFTWEAVPGTRFYELEAQYGDPGTWAPLVLGSVENSIHYESGYSEDELPYMWRVRANYADLSGWSEWSESRLFYVEPDDTDCFTR